LTPLGGIEATTASWTIGGQEDGCVLYQSARRVTQLDLWFSLRLGRRGRAGLRAVGFQNSAIGPDLGFYAARSYSLMRPPRTGRRRIRSLERSATE